jgi:hypothetical protein
MQIFTLNSNGNNTKIKAHILSDKEMRKIGFSDYAKENWYYCRRVDFHKEKRYKTFDITFNVTIPKNGSEIGIDILDDDFGQPYDYQRMLKKDHNFEPALIVKEFVEDQMKYLQDAGVLSGHVYGEYI